MQSQCVKCGAAVDLDRAGDLCEACLHSESPHDTATLDDAPEFDHRGIRRPARTRVGGIIIPQ